MGGSLSSQISLERDEKVRSWQTRTVSDSHGLSGRHSSTLSERASKIIILLLRTDDLMDDACCENRRS